MERGRQPGGRRRGGAAQPRLHWAKEPFLAGKHRLLEASLLAVRLRAALQFLWPLGLRVKGCMGDPEPPPGCSRPAVQPSPRP